MRCPFCSADKDKVIDSRGSEEGRVIRRRRNCLQCGKRFTTYERTEETPKLRVVKKDKSRVPYDRTRILAGIQAACYKRSIDAEQINRIVDEVDAEIFRTYDREVPSREIGDLVARRLRDLDQVAYVRFASVYRQFRDADDFIQEARVVKATHRRRTIGQRGLFEDQPESL